MKEYSPISDFERLKIQGDLFVEKDKKKIEKIVSYLENNNIQKPFTVLDAGCGFGYVTKKLFGNDNRFVVIGIDKSKKAIEKARELYSANNISYADMNVNNVTQKYNRNFDIVYSSFMLHHLPNADKIISKLWSTIKNKGVFFIRTVQDDLKCTYPKNEYLNFLVESSNIQFNIDRYQGKKLKSYFNKLHPKPSKIKLNFYEYNTATMTLQEQKNYFEIFYSYRLNPFKRKYESSKSTKNDEYRYKGMKRILELCRKEFYTNKNIVDVLFIPVFTAYK